VNIFKPWSEHHRKWFWKAFGHVAHTPDRRTIFLHLTKATAGSILAASANELEHALANFGLERTEDKDEMVRTLLLFVVTKLKTRKD
jgi:hypothetical protein